MALWVMGAIGSFLLFGIGVNSKFGISVDMMYIHTYIIQLDYVQTKYNFYSAQR